MAADAAAPAPARGPDRYPSGRPAPGSVRDLRARLDRLPDGHPSSPYEDGGLAKPWPHRLKQLELGLPAPEREPVDPGTGPAAAAQQAGPLPALAERSDVLPDAFGDGNGVESRMPDDQLAAAQETRPAEETRPADQARPTHETRPATASGTERPSASADDPAQPGSHPEPDRAPDEPAWRTDQDRAPDQPAWRADHDRAPDQPEVPRRDEHRNGAGNHTPDARAWRDPYAAPPGANGLGRRDRRAPADHAPDSRPRYAGRPPAGSAGRDANGDHVRSNGRAADQPGPRLSEDQGQLVAGMVAACRAAEGRSMFDEYGERGLTPLMRRIVAQLPHGGLAPGSEADSLKSPQRLAAKLARLIARHPGRTAQELAAGIGDGVRYAFMFDPDYYAEGTWLVHRTLKAQGFELEARRNRWDSPEYKGIWTRWRDPAHDLSFEVQFHTAASWDVVRRTHGAYVRITDPATPAAERARLRARQVAAAASAPAPPQWAEISDFSRRRGDS